MFQAAKVVGRDRKGCQWREVACHCDDLATKESAAYNVSLDVQARRQDLHLPKRVAYHPDPALDPIEGWERRLTSITHVVHKAYLPESVS
jgi:hypothetical protein